MPLPRNLDHVALAYSSVQNSYSDYNEDPSNYERRSIKTSLKKQVVKPEPRPTSSSDAATEEQDEVLSTSALDISKAPDLDTTMTSVVPRGRAMRLGEATMVADREK